MGNSHGHGFDADAGDERGLWGIAAFAFALGFAHEEKFEILGFCIGTDRCLESCWSTQSLSSRTSPV